MYEVQQHRIAGGGADWAPYDPAESRVLDEAQARMVAEALRGGTAALGAPQRSIVDMLAAGGGGDEAARGGDGFPGAQMAAADGLRGAGAAQPERVASGAREGRADASESPVVARAPPVAAAHESQAAAATDRAPAAAASGAHAAVGADSVGAPRAKLEVDRALVQRFLDTKDGAGEPMKLLLEDFGGQDSFYELYSILFSEFAVYVLAFNMEWLLPGSPDREDGLAYLRHWLHTVGVYCRNTSIMLVGTHKDRVREPREHELMSGLLHEQFREHPSWPSVSEWKDGQLSTGRGVLCFFPVDNTLGNRDPAVGALMREVEARVRESEHLQHTVPFAWMALLDRLEALKQGGRAVVALDEFRALCGGAGLPSAPGLGMAAEADMALRFFNRLGLLMHHPSVPQLVILRPAEFLFPYFTQVICDFRVHSALIPEHAAARKRHPREFQQLQTKGVLSARLLGPLWEGREHQEAVRQLMVSLGLMVPVLASEEGGAPGDADDAEFLVPSILPHQPAPAPPQRAALTARVVFAVASAVGGWRRSGYLSLEAARREAQVPAGVFSRLLGAMASLCQQTEPFPSVLDMQVFRNSAACELGRSRFTLINDGYCVAVHIEEGTGYAVSEMLQGQLTTIVDRCLEQHVARCVWDRMRQHDWLVLRMSEFVCGVRCERVRVR